MGYPVIRYPGSRAHRGFSADLWRQTLEQYATDPFFGRLEFTDCDEEFANPGDAAATAIDKPWFIQDMAAGGTVESLVKLTSTDYAADYGVWRLSATTGTDHFGIEMHRGLTATTAGECHINAGQRIVFETLVDVDNSDLFYIGLTEPIVQFLDATSDVPLTSDYIGFYKDESTGDLTFHIFNDNAGGTAQGVTATILANADIPANDWLKLGFAINADSTVTIVVDGTAYESGDLTWTGTIAATDTVAGSLPIEPLTRKYISGRGSVGDDATVDLDIDWTAIFVQGEANVI